MVRSNQRRLSLQHLQMTWIYRFGTGNCQTAGTVIFAFQNKYDGSVVILDSGPRWTLELKEVMACEEISDDERENKDKGGSGD